MVDVNKFRRLADRFRVESVPTFIFFKHGRKVKKLESDDLDSVEATIDQLTDY